MLVESTGRKERFTQSIWKAKEFELKRENSSLHYMASQPRRP